jgi:hypothetical protein
MQLLAFAVLGLGLFGADVPTREHTVLCWGTSVESDQDAFPWQVEGPLELIEHLKSLHRAGAGVLGYSVECEHFGWVAEADIHDLIELLDSSEACAGVVSSVSSWLPTEPSTVGREALFLIDGYRQGVYPPAIASQRHNGSAEEVKAWWRQHQSGRLTTRSSGRVLRRELAPLGGASSAPLSS